MFPSQKSSLWDFIYYIECMALNSKFEVSTTSCPKCAEPCNAGMDSGGRGVGGGVGGGWGGLGAFLALSPWGNETPGGSPGKSSEKSVHSDFGRGRYWKLTLENFCGFGRVSRDTCETVAQRRWV
jgi:hypothetical protein